MNREEKKLLERDFAITFLKEMEIEADLDPFHTEEPDILIREFDNLGIEVTQIYNSTIPGGISRVAIEGSWDFILGLAQTDWINSGLPSAHLVIIFDSSYHNSKDAGRKKAKELVDFIKKYLPIENSSYWSSDDCIIHPKGVVEFHIHRYDELTSTHWTFNDAIWPPNLTIEDVDRTILRKEKRRLSYLKNCDRIWLLIVLYGGRASGAFEISEPIRSKQYQFHFDRVFIFDAIPKRIWELQHL